MIWDFIRDFIVEHITGGTCSNANVYSGFMGLDDNDASLGTWDFIVTELHARSPSSGEIVNIPYSLGDWLATTLTIICMCLIVAFAIWLVIWVFKAVAHAFLLRR